MSNFFVNITGEKKEDNPMHIIHTLEQAYRAGWKGVGLGPTRWAEFVAWKREQYVDWEDCGVGDYKGMVVKKTPAYE